MIYSTDRILTMHAGALPRPPDLREMVLKKSRGEAVDEAAFEARLKSAIAEIVQQQVKSGVDCINDGELSKSNFTDYVRARISGFETRPAGERRRLEITARDRTKFPDYFEVTHNVRARLQNQNATMPVCVDKLRFIGAADLKRDLDNFKAAVSGVKVAETYLPANTPGTIEHWMQNEYYKSDEEFVFAIADVMHEEYKAIVDAGFQLQIDDPDLPDGWNCLPKVSVDEYRKYATLRVEALNHALRGIPKEKVRLHVCWGSFHGPHQDDIPLKDIADLIFRVKASEYSIEASNPAHEHEWNVFEKAKLPAGATLIPGVVGHCSDFIENPELVAQRLVRYAKLVGRDHVMAGTDCGLGPRVKDGKIAWAKLEALAKGARLASKELWAKGKPASARRAASGSAKVKKRSARKPKARARAGRSRS
jgi:5-methyltetrahydropteroyltriglutamate--homocysteine methyltransferase